MKLNLVRIDDRFIHGQVLTKWIKVLPAQRIIIVNNEIANDEMMKTLALSVAPSNVKASAVTVSKMGRAYKSPRYEETTAFLLLASPRDVIDLIKEGVDIKTVNVGGIRFTTGRKQITKAISVSEDDINAFRELHKMGVKLDTRQLPENTSQDFMKLLEEVIK